MQKGWIIAIVAAVVIVLGFFAYRYSQTQANLQTASLPTGQTQQNNTVIISNFAFSPQTLTINTGETVTWINQDSVQHSIVSDSGTELSSELLGKGESFTHTFDTPGTYEYHCVPHTNMKAKVIVK